MQAVADNGGAGWMIWNASAVFTEDALGPPVAGEAPAPMTSAAPPSEAGAARQVHHRPMRLVIQRVSRAIVRADGRQLGSIGRGAVVLVGIGPADDGETVDRMATKLLGLRYFADADGRSNLALDGSAVHCWW